MTTPSIEKTLRPKESFIFKDLVASHFNPNWHFHPEFQLSFIVKGNGTRFIGDHVHTFNEGGLVLTGPNLPHLWRSDDAYFEKGSNLKTRGLVIYFDHELFSKSLLEKEEFYKVNKLLERSARGMEFNGTTKKKVVKLLLQIQKYSGFDRILKLFEILNLLAQSDDYDLLSSLEYNNTFNIEDTEKMQIVYDYVMSNFKSKISLNEISSMLNMTTTSFCRYFKPRANKTFTRFVNDIRIGHVKKLLYEDNLNISEICYSSGFNTLSNFNRQFKAVTNMSPYEYRSLFSDIKSNIS